MPAILLLLRLKPLSSCCSSWEAFPRIPTSFSSPAGICHSLFSRNPMFPAWGACDVVTPRDTLPLQPVWFFPAPTCLPKASHSSDLRWSWTFEGCHGVLQPPTRATASPTFGGKMRSFSPPFTGQGDPIATRMSVYRFTASGSTKKCPASAAQHHVQ